MKTHITFTFLFITTFGFAQIPNKTFDWTNAGNNKTLAEFKSVNIWNYGGDNLGRKSNYTAFNKAKSALGSKGGIIYFRDGVYLFDRGIEIPSNVIIIGQGKATTLAFELSIEQDAITLKGSTSSASLTLAKSAFMGTDRIELINTAGISKGDLLKLSLPNSTLTTSEWAKGSIGQLTKIKSISGNTVLLEDQLRFNFPLDQTPKIEKIIPIANAGISCLQIIGQDNTVSSTSLIKLEYTNNCFVKNVVSEYCNLAHVEISNSYKTEVKGCYFRLANDVSGSSLGHGVSLKNSSSNCLIEDNIFSFLTHSILLQAGTNGNVIAYNYSLNTYWEKEGEPSNASGDILLFGNYPSANLFEGNIVQNIVLENKNGKNGPYNMFFRNTAELFGLHIKPTSADSTNVIRNRITNNGNQFGNFILNGNGVYNNENWVRTKIKNDSITKITQQSFYQKDSNAFTLSLGRTGYRIEAEKRYREKSYVGCFDSTEVINSKITKDQMLSVKDIGIEDFTVYPNPASKFLIVKIPSELPNNLNMSLYNNNGVLVFKSSINGSNQIEVDISNFNAGIYHINILTETTKMSRRVIIKN